MKNQGAVKKSGVRTCLLYFQGQPQIYLPTCSRLEWFRFNESAHVMVKQKTLATDLSRGPGLVKSSFRSNPSVFGQIGQIRAVSGQIRAVFFLELWLKSTDLHACFFATFCIDSPLGKVLILEEISARALKSMFVVFHSLVLHYERREQTNHQLTIN